MRNIPFECSESQPHLASYSTARSYALLQHYVVTNVRLPHTLSDMLDRARDRAANGQRSPYPHRKSFFHRQTGLN